jgi:hypothetical protein
MTNLPWCGTFLPSSLFPWSEVKETYSSHALYLLRSGLNVPEKWYRLRKLSIVLSLSLALRSLVDLHQRKENIRIALITLKKHLLFSEWEVRWD